MCRSSVLCLTTHQHEKFLQHLLHNLYFNTRQNKIDGPMLVRLFYDRSFRRPWPRELTARLRRAGQHNSLLVRQVVSSKRNMSSSSEVPTRHTQSLPAFGRRNNLSLRQIQSLSTVTARVGVLTGQHLARSPDSVSKEILTWGPSTPLLGSSKMRRSCRVLLGLSPLLGIVCFWVQVLPSLGFAVKFFENLAEDCVTNLPEKNLPPTSCPTNLSSIYPPHSSPT